MLSAIAIMNSATYFPEFVKANSASGLMFAIIFRKPKTGDCRDGEKIVSFTFAKSESGYVFFKNNHFSTKMQFLAKNSTIYYIQQLTLCAYS